MLVDEQWVSTGLRLLIAGHYSDSRTGVTDYRLTKLRLVDPSPDLFIIPEEYKLLDPRSAGSTEDPWLIDSAPERYVAELAAGRIKQQAIDYLLTEHAIRAPDAALEFADGRIEADDYGLRYRRAKLRMTLNNVTHGPFDDEIAGLLNKMSDLVELAVFATCASAVCFSVVP